MCGGYSLGADPERLAGFTGVPGGFPGWAPGADLRPGARAPLVRSGPGGAPEGALALWGLVPARAARPGTRPMINARVETAAVRPSFRDLVNARRCWIPADGFFEWGGTPRRRYQVTLEGGGLFGIAGLWDRRASGGGEAPERFTLLTTRANPKIAAIHDRMPVLLDPARREAWMESGEPFSRLAAWLADPFPAHRLLLLPAPGSGEEDLPLFGPRPMSSGRAPGGERAGENPRGGAPPRAREGGARR